MMVKLDTSATCSTKVSIVRLIARAAGNQLVWQTPKGVITTDAFGYKGDTQRVFQGEPVGYSRRSTSRYQVGDTVAVLRAFNSAAPVFLGKITQIMKGKYTVQPLDKSIKLYMNSNKATAEIPSTSIFADAGELREYMERLNRGAATAMRQWEADGRDVPREPRRVYASSAQ